MNKILSKDFIYDSIVLNDLYNIVILLFDKMKLNDDGYPINIEYAEFYVVNCCLYCELCFKSLLLKDGKDVEKVHDLLKLFDELSYEQKNIIASKTISKFFPSSDYLTPFREFLDKEKNNFVEFRYLIFSNSEGYTCCSFLNNLSSALNEIINN